MDKIKCLICGKYFSRVCRHAQQKHGVFAREYKERFGLDVKKGILTDKDREIMREHTFANKTVENLKKGEKFWFKKGQKGIGTYQRSEQTLKRLREHGKYLPHPKGRTLVKIICKVCGKERYTNPFEAKRAKYCSQHCYMIDRNRKEVKL